MVDVLPRRWYVRGLFEVCSRLVCGVLCCLALSGRVGGVLAGVRLRLITAVVTVIGLRLLVMSNKHGITDL